MNILNLPNWEVLDKFESVEDYLFISRYNKQPGFCPRCGRMMPRLHAFGIREQNYLDLPVHNKSVKLNVQRQRYKCLDCKKVFMQPLPDVHESRHATKRLVDYVEKETLKRTWASIASDVGLTEGAVRVIIRRTFHVWNRQ
jgi:transposase